LRATRVAASHQHDERQLAKRTPFAHNSDFVISTVRFEPELSAARPYLAKDRLLLEAINRPILSAPRDRAVATMRLG